MSSKAALWAILALIISYTFYNIGGAISDAFNLRLRPVILKWIDKSQIVEKRKYDSIDKANDAKRKEIERLQEQLLKIEQDSEKRILSANEQVSAREDYISELTTQNSQLHSSVKNLTSVNEELEEQNRQLTTVAQELADAKIKIDELTRKLELLKNNILDEVPLNEVPLSEIDESILQRSFEEINKRELANDFSILITGIRKNGILSDVNEYFYLKDIVEKADGKPVKFSDFGLKLKDYFIKQTGNKNEDAFCLNFVINTVLRDSSIRNSLESIKLHLRVAKELQFNGIHNYLKETGVIIPDKNAIRAGSFVLTDFGRNVLDTYTRDYL